MLFRDCIVVMERENFLENFVRVIREREIGSIYYYLSSFSFFTLLWRAHDESKILTILINFFCTKNNHILKIVFPLLSILKIQAKCKYRHFDNNNNNIGWFLRGKTWNFLFFSQFTIFVYRNKASSRISSSLIPGDNQNPFLTFPTTILRNRLNLYTLLKRVQQITSKRFPSPMFPLPNVAGVPSSLMSAKEARIQG